MEIEQLFAKSKISMFNLGHIENILDYRTHIDNLVVKSLEVHAHSLLVLMAKWHLDNIVVALETIQRRPQIMGNIGYK